MKTIASPAANLALDLDAATPLQPGRRRFLGQAAALSALAASGLSLSTPALAAPGDKITIGYYPIVGGLPLYVALERGFFKEAGLNVEGVKFASPQQIGEAMVAGRIQGSANGTATGILGLAELTSPNLLKIICSNPSNHKLVLDEFLVPMNSPAKSIADLAGKRIATGPGIQNVTLTKIILEKNGYPNAKVTELPVGQHLAALAAGQVDGVYALEPTGTIGRLKGMARTLETGVISKYVLGNAEAPWFGGAATLTTAFLKERPAEARKYVAAYAKAVELILAKPAEVRQHLDGFTGIEEALVKEVPLPGFVMHNQFKPSDLDYFQKYFDVLAERKIFSAPLAVKPLIYQG